MLDKARIMRYQFNPFIVIAHSKRLLCTFVINTTYHVDKNFFCCRGWVCFTISRRYIGVGSNSKRTIISTVYAMSVRTIIVYRALDL